MSAMEGILCLANGRSAPIIMLVLSSFADDSSSSDVPDAEDAEDDVARVFGLTSRDMARSSKHSTLADMSSRQLAFCLAGVRSFVVAADLLECGGEVDACQDVHCRISARVSFLQTCVCQHFAGEEDQEYERLVILSLLFVEENAYNALLAASWSLLPSLRKRC